MTDLEITKLCAEAMGYTVVDEPYYEDDIGAVFIIDGGLYPVHAEYAPLHNDTQAMALVKQFKLSIQYISVWDLEEMRLVWSVDNYLFKIREVIADDLSRAICTYTAKMQQAFLAARQGAKDEVA